jgi:magnesium chelatase family protein
MNPCPCGYANSSTRYCTCTLKQITAYQNKLSGPLCDRFDINLSLHPVRLKSISEENTDSSSMIRSRVEEARSRQHERYGKEAGNGKVSYAELLNSSPLTPEQQKAD